MVHASSVLIQDPGVALGCWLSLFHLWLCRGNALIAALMTNRSRHVFSSFVALALLVAVQLEARQSPFRPEKLAEMDKAIRQAIGDKKCPGGVLWLEHNGAVYHKAYGNRAVAPKVER